MNKQQQHVTRLTNFTLTELILCAILLLQCAVGLGYQQNKTELDNSSTSPHKDELLDGDPARTLFQHLFKQRRAEHLQAVKGLLQLNHHERQYKMISIISEKLFGVIKNSRATLESSGYVPGSHFPQDANVRDALSSILENTALISELVLRLPDLVRPLLAAHHDWEILLHWSLGFCSETRLLDSASRKLLRLVAQELGLVEHDPDYINPYRKKPSEKISDYPEPLEINNKPKQRKKIRKGPQLSKHTEL